jgi:hypothetical protein
VGRWIDSSRRFKEFTTQYRSKIHKKIRLAQSDPAIQDLTAELDVAYQLLQQKQFTVAYEPYSSEKVRNPDFAVIFKYYLRLSGILTRTLSG